MFKRVIKSKLAKNSLWMLVLQFFSTIMPMLTLPYITRILSKSAYGELSLALSYIAYFQVVVEYGFRLSGAKKTAMRKNDSEVSDVSGNIFFSRLLLMFVCLMSLVIFALFTPIKKSLIICMFILFLMVVALVFQQNWFFQGIAEMKNITFANVIGRLISVVLVFLLVKSPDHLYLYCAIHAFGYVFSCALGFMIAKKKYHLKINYNGFGAVITELKDGWPLFVSTAMGTLFSSVGVTILGVMESSEVVGVYSAVSKIPYVLNMIFSAFSQALYPVFCQGFAVSFDEGARLLRKYGIPIVVFFSVCGIFIVLFSESVVKIAFGADYLSGVILLIPFTIWIVLGIINNFLGIQTLVASGHDKEYSRAFLVSIIVMIVSMIVLGHYIGSIGVALSSMFAEFLLTILLVRYCILLKRKKI